MKEELKLDKASVGAISIARNFEDKTQEKGITLVALIITIIVLIILAAVTIITFTDSGLMQTASKGAENYANAQKYEQGVMDNLTSLADQIVANITGGNGGNGGGIGTPPEPVDPTANWDLTKVNKVTSEDGIVVPVPKGFTVSTVTGEKSVKTGLVIKQDGTANEFVWVPVANPSEMLTTDPDGSPAGQLWNFGELRAPENKFVAKNPPEKRAYSSTGYREPDIVTAWDGADATGDASYFKSAISETMTGAEFKQQLQNEFNQMKASVEKYNGFYIGRYETGDLSKTKAVVAKNNSDISNQNWYVQYQKSKTIVEGKSSMIWGCQWDAVMKWFLSSEDIDIVNYVTNSTGKGNYSGTQAGENKRIATGSNDDYAVNNIYDIAGNVGDWTIEILGDSHHVIRRWGY